MLSWRLLWQRTRLSPNARKRDLMVCLRMSGNTLRILQQKHETLCYRYLELEIVGRRFVCSPKQEKPRHSWKERR